MFTSCGKALITTAAAVAGALMPAAAFSASSPAATTVQFLSADGVVLPDDCSIEPEAPTFFVVHGFRDKGTSAASLRQAAAIRQRSPRANVIVVHATTIWGDEDPIGTVDIYLSWPGSGRPDSIWQHSQARELVTTSFLRPEISNTDGTPFGANALGFALSDRKPRNYEPAPESTAHLASLALGEERGQISTVPAP